MHHNVKLSKLINYFNLFNGEDWIREYTNTSFERLEYKEMGRKSFADSLNYLYTSTHEELVTEFLDRISKNEFKDILALKEEIIQKIKNLKPIHLPKLYNGKRWLKEYADSFYQQASCKKIAKSQFLFHAQNIYRGTALEIMEKMIKEINDNRQIDFESFRGFLHIMLDKVYAAKTWSRIPSPTLNELISYDERRYQR